MLRLDSWPAHGLAKGVDTSWQKITSFTCDLNVLLSSHLSYHRSNVWLVAILFSCPAREMRIHESKISHFNKGLATTFIIIAQMIELQLFKIKVCYNAWKRSQCGCLICVDVLVNSLYRAVSVGMQQPEVRLKQEQPHVRQVGVGA